MPDETNSGPRRGSCLCGAVRFEVSGDFGAAEHCHCSICRKAHGAAFSSNAAVDARQFRVVAGAECVGEYASSPHRRRCFCRNCGSPLFIRRLTEPLRIAVALAALDGEDVPVPERHVFAGSKADWLVLDDELPRFAVYPVINAEDER